MPHLDARPARTRGAGTLLALALVLAAGCGPATTGELETNTANGSAGMAETQAGDWEVLFDGTDLRHWRGYRRDDAPASWSVQDGTLAFAPSPDRAQRGDLVTREQYGDFELELEWKISPGGNSGVIYRSTEDQEHPWHTGPEMQVLDDERHPDGQIPSHRAGALYDLIVPPAGATRPVGEWNQARIVVQGDRIQHFLNGQKTADIVIGSDEWNRRMAESKFRDMPAFATRPAGHIVLQDHDDPVWYRNVRIRRLDSGR